MNKKDFNVLMYTRPLAPPWDEASKNLAFEIAKHASNGIKFQLLTTRDYAKKISFEKNLLPEPVFSSTKFGKLEKFLLLKRLYRLNLNSDIIHFLFTPRKITSSLIKARLSFSKTKTIQTIATLADSLFSDSKSLHKILFADQVITQSQYTKNRLQQAGIENVKTIYPGIDLEKFTPKSKSNKLMDNFKISHNDFVILFAGEYTRLKAIDDVMDAFEILMKNAKNTSYKLVCACRIKSDQDKQKKRAIVEKTKKLAYDEHIVFIETFADMPSLYNLSDLNIFPVREMVGKFDIPLAVVEAMACRKPVIISDIPVLEEFVQHKKTGIVVPKGVPAKLARKIQQLSENNQLRDTIAKNAFDYATSKFNISNTAQEYTKIYEKLITS